MKKFLKKFLREVFEAVIGIFQFLLSSFLGGYIFAGLAIHYFHNGIGYYAGAYFLMAIFFAINYIALKVNHLNDQLGLLIKLQNNCAESLVTANKVNCLLTKTLVEFCENEKSV